MPSSTQDRRTKILLGHLRPTEQSVNHVTHQICSGESSLDEPIGIKIFGVGRHLPPHIVTSEVVDGLCGLPKGYTERTSGVKERRYVQSVEKLAQKRYTVHTY
jgi:hypothetical protein